MKALKNENVTGIRGWKDRLDHSNGQNEHSNGQSEDSNLHFELSLFFKTTNVVLLADFVLPDLFNQGIEDLFLE